MTEIAHVKQIMTALCGWYTFSFIVTAFNKLIIERLDFDFPLLITFAHFSVSSIVLHTCYSCMPNAFPKFPRVPFSVYAKLIVPTALFSASEIVLSNVTYPMVPVAAMAVVKSTTILSTYIFGVILGHEKFRWRLLFIIVFIFTSVALSVPSMPVENFAGVFLLLTASVLGAARWTLVHQQLKNEMIVPLHLLRLTLPVSAILLAPLVLIVDFGSLIPKLANGSISENKGYEISMLLGATAVSSFLLVLFEYIFVKATSSVTLSIAGVGKEVMTIVLSAFIFKEYMKATGVICTVCSIIGIIIYIIMRYKLATKVESTESTALI